ncbi:MAG: hypothetical protein WCC17_18350 [Candidatus Nitrosopolaris sp.]
MNSKTTMTFSSMAIAAVVLLFVSGPIVGNQQALAANLCGSGLGCGGTPDYGISYPSPLSNFFGGYYGCGGCYDSYPYSGFGFHHFHGGFGFHHFHGGFGFHHFHGGFGFHHFHGGFGFHRH